MHGQQNDKYTEMHGQQNDKYTEMHSQQNDKYTEMHGQQNVKKLFWWLVEENTKNGLRGMRNTFCSEVLQGCLEVCGKIILKWVLQTCNVKSRAGFLRLWLHSSVRRW